jgi:hypothetical protein
MIMDFGYRTHNVDGVFFDFINDSPVMQAAVMRMQMDY